MAAIDYLTLRSTLMYTAPGVLAPAGSIFTVGSSGMQALNTSLSTLGASTITVSTLFGSTLYGSTMVASGISLSTLTVSTINGALPGAGSGTALTSTMVSIGASTNLTNNVGNGSYTTGWGSTLTGTTAIKKVVLSNNGATQTILQNSGSTMSTVITSLDSGLTWAGSTMRGLPTSGALPYQTYGSTINAMAVPSITAMTAAPSSGNQLAIASNDLVYTSANSGATFAPTGLGQNNNPFIYIPFDGSSVADVMGNSVVTATGSVAFNIPSKVGTHAVNLVNTSGSTANNYIRGTWTGFNAFTVSFWFNAQTLSGSSILFMTANDNVVVFINSGNFVISLYIGGTIINGPVISTNTWYNVTVVFQNGGTSSLYVNNSFSASGTGSWNPANITRYGIGTTDFVTPINAFNGYIDDFRVYNYAVTNPSGAALINPLVGPIAPYVYLTFDGSATADLMGNSTTTVTGSVGYVTGQVGSNAIFFGNAGTGVNPIQYVTGTVSGLGNTITVSFWFYTFVLPTSVQATVWSMNAVTSGGAIVQFSINTAGTASFQYYNGSAWQIVNSASAISLSTWYNAVCVYQAGSTCSLYLNGALTTITGSGSISPAIASYTLGGGQGTPATPNYGFYGVIDDFRIYNGAFLPSTLSPVLTSPSYAIGSPNIYLPFENGSVLDVLGYSAISARGTMNFVPGVVGTAALNLVNPAGGTAVNYLRGSWAGSPNFTVSFWFNVQALGVTQQVLFAAYAGNYVIYLNSSGQILIYLPSGGAALNALTSPAISINTWYYVTAIFQTNGTCALYVNNSLAGTYTNSGGVGSYTNAAFSIATYDINLLSAFNGYIDDFKLYNCAIPYNTLGPMNYTQAAMSNTGAYQVVAAANGGVYTSADSGSSWSQASLAALQPVAAVNAVSGQVIIPQLSMLTNSGTALTTSPWTQNGVTWVASTSGIYNLVFSISNLFNNYNAINNVWQTLSTTYTTSGNTSGQTTTIMGSVGIVTGDWAQIQTSIPLIMFSYSFGIGASVGQLPKTYYIVGSNDGATWYPIQYAAGGAVTTGSAYTSIGLSIIVNSTSTQTFGTSTIATTAYSTATNAYTYFRLILLSNYNASATSIQIGEWPINFVLPSTPLYVAPSTALIANQSLNTITVMPQQTGLSGGATTTWTTNGISWTASSSSIYNSLYYAYYAFNNILTGTTFASNTTYTAGGATQAGSPSTAVTGLSAQVGEWIQLQSSVPLVMNSYIFSCGGAINLFPKTYIIIGSNDGTTWYPIQSVNLSDNPYSTILTSWQQSLIVNFTGSQTITAQNTVTAATVAYGSTTTNAYTYFRVIATSTNGVLFELAEWFANFTAYTPALVNANAVSPTGQYMVLTGTGATSPNSTAAVASTWTANGVTWTAAASSFGQSGSNLGYYAFNNAFSVFEWSCVSSGSYTAATPGIAYGTAPIVSNITGLPSGTSIQGEWLQLQSSVPLIMNSYVCASGGGASGYPPQTYYILGSVDGTNWFNLQYASLSTNPGTIYAPYWPAIVVNSTSVQPIAGRFSAIATTTASSYAANAYTYFRIVITSVFTGPAVAIGEWYINFQSGPTFYSTDYGSSWTRALSAATIPNANMLATSGNGQYSLQGYGQTVTLVSNTLAGYSTGTYTTPTFTPVLSASVGAVNCASISLTGQYMVILIQSTSNNVYYSTNYGVSFTGLTVGSSSMMSCAISVDGSYITVANMTQVYTLNRNIQGYSVAVGNQAGQMNQAQNAIAIGNQAGQINQSANSIILNASGSALNAYLSGFYVSPIANYASSSVASFSILGYGSDSQVVQTGMTILSNGNVGIGTTNPGYSLHVIGAIYANGNITALSDQRYKQNIVRLDRSLDMICSLNGYSYTRDDYQPGIRQIGLLAQEVDKVIPEAVSYDSANDTYSLNYGCLIAPVIEAVKEINDKVDSRIREMEAKIGAQQVLIQTLLDRAL